MGASMIDGMTMVRKTITLDAKVAAEVQAIAPDGNFSALVDELLEKHLRSRHLRALLDEYQAEHCAFSDEEIEAAVAELRGDA